MEKSVHDSISSLGENVIYVHKFPWGLNFNEPWWDLIKRPVVSKNDYQAVLNKSTKTAAACFTVSQSEPIKYRKNIANNVDIMSVTPEFGDIRAFEVENGRYFSPEKADPVGKQITISGKRTTVIGVFKKEGKGGISDSGMDEEILVPLNFGITFINMKNMFLNATLMIKAKDGVPLQELSDETTMILRASRKLRPNETDDFALNKASLISQSFDGVFAGINIGGWVIGGFAILVGGFGIANIMFVSVRERTNIIGIQKALGAKKFFILQQFLVESMLLSVIGGLLGILMIFIATLVINYLYDLNMYLTVSNMFLAVFISGLIGVVAGYAPANTAAKMNPVEAIGFSF
jgi:putative ABC transport system permease protein